MENYLFQNLCSWTEDFEIICPMGPATLIKCVKAILKGKFGGLARVVFQHDLEYAYQKDEFAKNYFSPTGLDTLIYKAEYKNAVTMLLFVDDGNDISVIAQMTRFNDQQTNLIVDEKQEEKYIKTLDRKELLRLFMLAENYIKINEPNAKYKPSFAIQI
jgi:hypothetical protein